MAQNRAERLIGALADLFPDELTPEQLHAFTKAPIGVCVHVLNEVKELRNTEYAEYLDGIIEERLKDRIEHRRIPFEQAA